MTAQGDSAAQHRVVKVYFEATEAEFDVLHDKVVDAITAAMGCSDDEHECPHFRMAFGGTRKHWRGRRWAIRCAFVSLWEAVRYGEV